MRRSPLLLLVPLLSVLGVACGSADGEADEATTTTSTTEVPPTTGTTQPLPLAARKAQLQLAPVLSNGPCDDEGDPLAEGGGDPVGETPATDTTVPAPGSDRTPDREGFLCYELGPVGGDGTDLTSATAGLDPQTGAWKVDVQASPASAAALNLLFDACFAGQPTCPAGEGGNGAVAIVYRGAVVSAPSVQAASLADDTFTISGAFGEEEAAELADVLNA